jgi:hypothetical protein
MANLDMGQGVFQQVVSVWCFLGSLDHHTNKTVIKSINDENGTMTLRNMYSTKDIEMWGETLQFHKKWYDTTQQAVRQLFLSGKTQPTQHSFLPCPN